MIVELQPAEDVIEFHRLQTHATSKLGQRLPRRRCVQSADRPSSSQLFDGHRHAAIGGLALAQRHAKVGCVPKPNGSGFRCGFSIV